MKWTQALLYIGTVCLIYLGLFGIELLIIKPIIAGFNLNFIINISISLVLILVINTLLTKMIVEKIPFKQKNLKAKQDHNVNWHTYE